MVVTRLVHHAAIAAPQTRQSGAKRDSLFRRGDAEKNAERNKRKIKAKAEGAEGAENREELGAEGMWRQSQSVAKRA